MYIHTDIHVHTHRHKEAQKHRKTTDRRIDRQADMHVHVLYIVHTDQLRHINKPQIDRTKAHTLALVTVHETSPLSALIIVP